MQEIHRLSQIVKTQREDLKDILKRQSDLEREISNLRKDYLGRKPLSKEDVEKLVLKISEQPKFIEKQTEALTEELSRKVDKVEGLIHRLEKVLTG